MMNRIWLMMLLAVTFGLSPAILSAASMPSVGSVAPEFTLPSQEGSPISLKGYRGKWVVLYFYPKDFTSGCTIEAHNFQRDQAQYQKKGVVVLGVAGNGARGADRIASGRDFRADLRPPPWGGGEG